MISIGRKNSSNLGDAIARGIFEGFAGLALWGLIGVGALGVAISRHYQLISEGEGKSYSSSVSGRQVASVALGWVGRDFNPGQPEQCAFFVRAVLEEVGLEVGVTNSPIDEIQFSKGEGLANSFFGSDVGEIIATPEDLLPGDLVAFANTYGNFPPGTITHVGIYVGDGMMVDRSTRSAPVRRIPLTHFPHFVAGVRPHAYAKHSADSNFERSVAFIFSVEGGLSDHPADRGGRTHMGITAAKAAEWGTTPDRVTKKLATEIYFKDYWEGVCDDLPFPLSAACLNTSVNSGVGKAREFNAAIDSNNDPIEEAFKYVDRQTAYYRNIVDRNPRQKVFLAGWMNRSIAFKEFVIEETQ